MGYSDDKTKYGEEAKEWAEHFGIDTQSTRSTSDGAMDAFRHAYASAAATQDHGETIASIGGWVNEIGGTTGSGRTSTEMDHANNAVGRSLAAGTTSRYEIAKKAFDALMNGQLTVINPITPTERANMNVPEECFAKGTLIATARGEVAVEDLRVGDLVQSFDPHKDYGRGEITTKAITNLFLNTTKEFLRLYWEEDGVGKELFTTPGHHFLREDGSFGPISEITEKGIARIVLANGSIANCTAESIVYGIDTADRFERATSHGILGSSALALQTYDEWEAYNFEVEDFHTYVALGVRVHNDCVASPTTGPGRNGVTGWFDGIDGNEGNEGNENNEGDEGDEDNEGDEGDEGNEGNEGGKWGGGGSSPGHSSNDGDEGNEGNEPTNTTGSGANGTTGWFDGISGNEGNEGNENNEGNEGDEGNEGNEGNEGDEGNEGNEGDEGNEGNEGGGGGGGGSGKPIVVDLDRDGEVELVSQDQSTAKFDFDNDGYREQTAWVGADDGLLVFDVGNDGKVTEAKEIAFAYWTEDEDDTDLEGLRAAFDSNEDGFLNALDDDWAQFRIWRDANQNGIADEGEFMTLEEAGIESINLTHNEGTSEVHADGTVNHGMIDVHHTDGTTDQAGDIAFAYDSLGTRETVGENGETIIEYEGDTFQITDPNEGFTASDYQSLMARILSDGFAETAEEAMAFATQNGDDVIFQFDGASVLTVEDVTIDQLWEGLNEDGA